MTIQDHYQQIHRLVAAGNHSEAIKRAMDFMEDYGAEPERLAQIVALSRAYHAAAREKKQHPEQADALAAEQEALLHQMYALLDQAKSAFSIPETAPEKPVVVALAGVGKRFRSSNFYLQNIDLQLHLGEITGIIGPNANGKSTLLKIIVGDLMKDEGTVRYPGFGQTGATPDWAALKQRIAYIPQELQPWKGALREVLLYEASRHGLLGKACELQVDFIVQRLGLADYIDLEWNQLSGGYKLRFELARALVWKPAFVVLDEPLANLDASAQLTILNDLRNMAHRLRNPICVIVTSQHIHEIEHIADKLLVLDNGSIIYWGRPFGFREEEDTRLAEFSGNASLEEVVDALPFPWVRVEDRGYCMLIEIPRAQAMHTVLETLLQKGIKIDYFRDITHSVKQIFYANN